MIHPPVGIKFGTEANDVGQHLEADVEFAFAEEGGAGAGETRFVEVAALQQPPHEAPALALVHQPDEVGIVTFALYAAALLA